MKDVSGELIESRSVAGHDFYRIEDDTGRLWVSPRAARLGKAPG